MEVTRHSAMMQTYSSPESERVAPQEHLRKGGDVGLLLSVIALVAIGIAMVFSTTYPLADSWRSEDSYLMLKRHLMFAGAAAFMLFLGYRLPFSLFRRNAKLFFFIGILLLVAVKLVGKEVNGARSWFPLGPVNFQPSEYAKLAVILTLAGYFARRPKVTDWKELLKGPLAMLFLAAGLIAVEPDMGSAMVLVLSMLVFLSVCGVPFRRLAAVLGILFLFGALMILRKPYQLRRITDWVNPQATASAGSYQTVRSLVALGSGGLFGLGYCQGREKYFYLPASHTDSILAIVGEELGLLGTWAVLGLLGWIVWRGFAISRAQNDRFAGLTAAGISCLIGTQSLINIAVVTGSIPATGITLPFISFGGSSLVFTLFGMGLLLNLSRRRPEALPVKVRRAGVRVRS